MSKCSVCVWGGGGDAQTDNETKLLYWAIFLFKMSEQGPSTRSKRPLSSLTHFRTPLATTVAARGRSRSRAISPEINKYIIWREETMNTLECEMSGV